jgi:hypothetical protein
MPTQGGRQRVCVKIPVSGQSGLHEFEKATVKDNLTLKVNSWNRNKLRSNWNNNDLRKCAEKHGGENRPGWI